MGVDSTLGRLSRDIVSPDDFFKRHLEETREYYEIRNDICHICSKFHQNILVPDNDKSYTYFAYLQKTLFQHVYYNFDTLEAAKKYLTFLLKFLEQSDHKDHFSSKETFILGEL